MLSSLQENMGNFISPERFEKQNMLDFSEREWKIQNLATFSIANAHRILQQEAFGHL